MSNQQFLVSMKFVGVDLVSAEIKQINDNMKNLGVPIKQIEEQAKTAKKSLDALGKGPSGGFKWADSLSNGLQKATKYIDDMQSKLEKMKSSGLGDVLTGVGTVAPMIKMAKQAGDIQMQQIQLGSVYGIGLNSAQMKSINDLSTEQSKQSMFSKSEILDIALSMAHGRVSLPNMQNVLPEAVKFSEFEVGTHKASNASDSAYNFAKMAEDAGITGDPTKLNAFADNLYRLENITHATSESLGESFKYGMPIAKMMGWNYQDMLDAQGALTINGIEGSMGGTHMKDFLERSNTFKLVGMDAASKQVQAAEQMGLISGVRTEKRGNKDVVVAIDQNALADGKNKLKGFTDMMMTMADAHEKFIKSGKSELEWQADLSNMYGQQAQDVATIISNNEQLVRLKASEKKEASLDAQAKQIRDSFNGEMAILGSDFSNLGTAIGNDLLPEITDAAKAMGPYVDMATEWVSKNKDLVVKIGEGVAAFAGLTIAIGGAKLIFGGIGTILNPFTDSVKAAMKVINDNVISPLKTKSTTKAAEELPTQTIRANVVNLYGAEINGGGGIDVSSGGGGGKAGKAASEAEQVVEELATKSKFGKVLDFAKSGLKIGGKTLLAGGKGLLHSLPFDIAFGLFDTLNAPDGQKLETGAKSMGRMAGSWAGAEAGGAFGAEIGSFFGPIGTAIGGGVGLIAGGILGDTVMKSLEDSVDTWLNGPKANFSDPFPSITMDKLTGYDGASPVAKPNKSPMPSESSIMSQGYSNQGTSQQPVQIDLHIHDKTSSGNFDLKTYYNDSYR